MGQVPRHRSQLSKAAAQAWSLAMGDGNGLAEAMLGLDGIQVLDVTEEADELAITSRPPP